MTSTMNSAQWHGRLLADRDDLDLPVMTKRCDVEARPGYDSMLAHEYQDTPKTLKIKVKTLAELLKRAERCVAYTGAGISTASGISDYATKGGSGGRGGKVMSNFDARPTLSHRVLVSMYEKGLLAKWFQQNHDGLPQKAGMPQHGINEIHGSWFDPSNPVIPMTGNLRSDYFEDLLRWEQSTDLVLVLGTSVAGMNADRMAQTVSQKAMKKEAIGAVMVNLQQTGIDSDTCLRIYAKLDDVFELLAKEMGLDVKPMSHVHVPNYCGKEVEDDVFVFDGYDGKTGLRAKGKTCKLDLREGAEVVLTCGPHKGDDGVVVEKRRQGHYRIRFKHAIKKRSKLKVPFQRTMGTWWCEAAAHGTIPQLPVVNVKNASVVESSSSSNITTFVLSTHNDEAVADTTGAFSVAPLKSCPHVRSVSDLSAMAKSAHLNQCLKCDSKRENWVCFETGKCFCGRYVQGHMLQHSIETGHCVCISLEDLSVWCFKCESYLDPFAIEPVREVFVKFHEEKFGTKPDIPKGETVAFAQKVVLRGKEEDVSTKADESVETERYD